MEHPNQLVCTACVLSIANADERTEHYRSDWHRYNIKRRCAGLGPIAKEMFESQVSALQTEKDKQTNLAKPKNCEQCKKTFQSEAAFQQHLSSKTHAKKIAKKGTGAPASPAQPPKKAGKLPNVPPLASPTKPIEDNKAEEKVEEAEEQDQAQEEEEEEGEGDEEQGTPIPLKHCLFCSQNFNDIPTALDHMLKLHGFFIPFIEYLHDLEGFLEYLGAKVGMGKVCLYCNGRGRAAYPTVHAVQQHMTAKQHCKLRFEEDEEDDEFLDFFNFPGMDDEGDEGDDDDDQGKKSSKGEEEGRKQKPRVVDVLPTGELLVSDGSIIGHRSLVRAYKQHVRPTESRYEVVLSQMTSRSGAYGGNPSSALIGVGGNAPGNGALIFTKRQEKLLRKQQRKVNKSQIENTRINKISLRTGVNGNLHRNLRYSAPSLF